VEAGTPVVVLLWNNRGYGEIRTCMTDAGIEPIGVDIHTPDFIGLARAFGCRAASASSIDELRAQLAATAAETRPTLIEIDEAASWLA